MYGKSHVTLGKVNVSTCLCFAVKCFGMTWALMLVMSFLQHFNMQRSHNYLHVFNVALVDFMFIQLLW
jgi:hypothetical protein